MTEEKATYTTDIAKAILALLAEDKELVIYRKSLKKITGTVVSAILLSQAMYWFKKSKGEPFYKFRSPCSHEDYRDGDSWTEEIGISPNSFDGALKRIGTKVTRGIKKTSAYEKNDATGVIVYWTDASRKTWYTLNMNLLGNLLSGIYLEDTEQVITSPLTETTAETAFAKEQKTAKPLSSEISDEEFWEKKNAEKRVAKDKERIPVRITGIEAAIFEGRPVDEKDMQAERGETIESRLSGWKDNAVLIVVRTYAEAYGQLPPAAPPKGKHSNAKYKFYYEWRAGAKTLTEITGKGDVLQIVRSLGAAYNNEYSAVSPNSIIRMVRAEMNKVEKKKVKKFTPEYDNHGRQTN